MHAQAQGLPEPRAKIPTPPACLPEKPWLIEATAGHEVVSPSVLPYEIGNALSAMVRRNALSAADVEKVWDVLVAIPVELVTVDVRDAVVLAANERIYAYDAYVLQCALETRSPLLTLDQKMVRVASNLNINVVRQP